MAKIEGIVVLPNWNMNDKCRVCTQCYDVFFMGRNQKWVSFEIGDRREDIEQQMNGSYMSPAFKRYLKTRRRNQTLRRKMERETKRLNRELWEVFGI